MLAEEAKNQKEDKTKTPPILISGYTKEEMEQLYS